MLNRQQQFSESSTGSLPRQNSTGLVQHQQQRQMSTSSMGRQSSSSSSATSSSGGGGGGTGNGVLRQGSQGSLFDQIASQAKDLVRETTRQSSQDGLLAHMDKV